VNIIATISSLDIFVLVAYIVIVVALGLWAGWKQKKSNSEAQDYFLAGKTLKWPMIGFALFATNISCVHLVALAQSGYQGGLVMGNFEWMNAFSLVILALFFLPFYLKTGVTTLPDFLEKRYNRPCRDWLSVLSIVSGITIHIGFAFLTGGLVMKSLFGIDLATTVIVIALITGLYTIYGGLAAVVWTETVQTIILLVGATLLTWFAWDKIGGWEPLVETLKQDGSEGKLTVLRGSEDPFPWYAAFCIPVIGIWYWCTDQTIVQRALGAKDEHEAKRGALFAGFLKILPVFIIVLPGVIAYALFLNGDFNPGADKDGKDVYKEMITQLLPSGLVGLMLATLLAALMSTVSGALNSISTLFSYDLYKRFKGDVSDHQLVKVGRIAAGVAMIIAIAIVPLLNNYGSLFEGLNEIIGHIAPPITAVFLIGVFWKGASARAAQWTLYLGSLAGVVVFIIGKTVGHGINFMVMALILFIFCSVVLVILSFVKPDEKPSELCWKSPLDPLRQPGKGIIGNYKVLAGVLCAIMVFLFWKFS